MESPFIDLVNSEWRDEQSSRVIDRVDDPAWLGSFLSKWELGLPASQIPELRSGLKDLRDVLRAEVKHAQSGLGLSTEGAERLNSAISGTRYRRYLAAASPKVEARPEHKDSAWVLAQIAESFVDVLANGDPRRLKFCANPECGWLFYDESRAMTRIWCDSRVCGNVMKVRRFRARSRENSKE